MKLFKYFGIAALLAASANSWSVYWTVKAEGGVIGTQSGSLGINIKNHQPTGPNPAGTVWESCYQNWIYFHTNEKHEAVDEKHVDRMFAIALAAQKTGNAIRVNVLRDEMGKCYTTQVYDLGYQ